MPLYHAAFHLLLHASLTLWSLVRAPCPSHFSISVNHACLKIVTHERLSYCHAHALCHKLGGKLAESDEDLQLIARYNKSSNGKVPKPLINSPLCSQTKAFAVCIASNASTDRAAVNSKIYSKRQAPSNQALQSMPNRICKSVIHNIPLVTICAAKCFKLDECVTFTYTQAKCTLILYSDYWLRVTSERTYSWKPHGKIKYTRTVHNFVLADNSGLCSFNAKVRLFQRNFIISYSRCQRCKARMLIGNGPRQLPRNPAVRVRWTVGYGLSHVRAHTRTNWSRISTLISLKPQYINSWRMGKL